MIFIFISKMTKIKSEDEQWKKGTALHPCYHLSDDSTSPKCWLLFSNDIKELKHVLLFNGITIRKYLSIGSYQEMAEGIVLQCSRNAVYEK